MLLKVEYVGDERNNEAPQPVDIEGHVFGPDNGWVVIMDSDEWERVKTDDVRLVVRDGTEPVPF